MAVFTSAYVLLAVCQPARADLLVGDRGTNEVLRYTESTTYPLLPTTGGVSGDANLSGPQGVAVAPDGTFYASSNSGRVVHYSNAGAFLGFLGRK